MLMKTKAEVYEEMTKDMEDLVDARCEFECARNLLCETEGIAEVETGSA